MNKVYNTQNDIASKIRDILLAADPNIRKTQLNIIPHIIIGIILAGSAVASNIAVKLKGQFSLVQHDSVIKRIRRLFKNKFFDGYYFYAKIITFVINSYVKKHKDKRVHIIFDHMFSHDNFTVFMITMRIGKQGIPLYFRCFENKDDPEAFAETTIIDGINFVSNLFKDKDLELIFLADRWFNSTSLLEHIDNLGHTFCVRLKKNIKVLVYDKKEGHKIWKEISELFVYKYHSVYYDVLLSENRLPVKIVISKKDGYDEPWIVATNGSYNFALKDYSYRFGGIETTFKNQKSNGFYLEKTANASLKYFISLYTFICVAELYMIILGSDYAKNTKCYKNVKIETHTKINGTKVRIMSLFRTGLTLFQLAYESLKYIRLPVTFRLYDS